MTSPQLIAPSVLQQHVHDAFRAFIEDAGFPCLAAKGTIHRGDEHLRVYGAIGSESASDLIAVDLTDFARHAATNGDRQTAFVAVFTGDSPENESTFERELWRQLQQLHDRDDPNAGWDPAVSADPDDRRFSFSFAGTAMFVVGLHPNSSRLARRFQWPALVFNPHAQFEHLRQEGRYERLRDLIREREVALQGSTNPNLSDFGERSEANQYSGRDTTQETWRCPFHRRTR